MFSGLFFLMFLFPPDTYLIILREKMFMQSKERTGSFNIINTHVAAFI